MAIDKKLLHFNKDEDFQKEVEAGNILNESIVFTNDDKKIYTHGGEYKTVTWKNIGKDFKWNTDKYISTWVAAQYNNDELPYVISEDIDLNDIEYSTTNDDLIWTSRGSWSINSEKVGEAILTAKYRSIEKSIEISITQLDITDIQFSTPNSNPLPWNSYDKTLFELSTNTELSQVNLPDFISFIKQYADINITNEEFIDTDESIGMSRFSLKNDINPKDIIGTTIQASLSFNNSELFIGTPSTTEIQITNFDPGQDMSWASNRLYSIQLDPNSIIRNECSASITGQSSLGEPIDINITGIGCTIISLDTLTDSFDDFWEDSISYIPEEEYFEILVTNGYTSNSESGTAVES